MTSAPGSAPWLRPSPRMTIVDRRPMQFACLFLESTQGSPPIAPSAGETDSGSADEGKRVNVVGAVRQRIGELDYVVDEHERMKTGNYVVNCADQTNCESRELGNRSGHVADQPEVRPLRSSPPPYRVMGNATG